jgi:hypothetical protein
VQPNDITEVLRLARARPEDRSLARGPRCGAQSDDLGAATRYKLSQATEAQGGFRLRPELNPSVYLGA